MSQTSMSQKKKKKKHLGQQGMLRASHHISLLPESEKDEFPRYDHKSRQDIPAGTIILLLIPVWPVGMVIEAGEGLMLRASGMIWRCRRWR